MDLFQKSIYPATVGINDGRIIRITPIPAGQLPADTPYILPGFIDAHVHIESSMLVPSEFARLAVVHGTVATVSDPHEIANVCGVEGVYFMIENGSRVPFKFYFGAPSCVPATPYETSGARLDASAVRRLLSDPRIKYLSEMMNFPGALQGDPEVMEKIGAARESGKPVDGHAPGLRGEAAKKYIEIGISTDHECFTREEALEKLGYGMKIIIREGSAARNFEALADLLNDYPGEMMFCSDDKHPDSLVEGHINLLCARAVARGIPLFNVLQAACVNPVVHYKLDTGLLREGDPADFILVDNLETFPVRETYVNGQLVASNGVSLISSDSPTVNNSFTEMSLDKNLNPFNCMPKTPGDFVFKNGKYFSDESTVPVIGALDGQLITNKIWIGPETENGRVVSDPAADLLKIAVVNRYKESPVSTAFIHGFRLKEGALASSVAHDSHNIVAVGTTDEWLCQAVNLVIRHRGGISFVNDDTEMVLPLPVAGLMTMEDGYNVAEIYSLMDAEVKKAGSTLSAPFMTLSFMALLVIPHLKISDLGLFDGDEFRLL